jgi:hypothetical protein
MMGEIMTPASTLSAPQGAISSTAPQRLQSLVIRGGGAPDVHVSLYAGRGQGPASDVAEVERTKPKPLRAHNTALEPVGRSGPAPESAERRGPAFESVGAKRTAPEQGLSDRPVKRACVCSRM